MKVFFCLGSMGNGGAERVVSILSNYLVEDNDISIIVTKNEESYYCLDNRIKYYKLDENTKRENVIKRTIKRTSKLRKLLKNEKPDIVISFLPEPSYRLMLAKTFLPVKTIISVRNDPNVEYNSYFKRLLVKLLYTRADGFVFQTSDAQKWFDKKIQNRSIVIANPVNDEFVCKPYLGERRKTIVTVGRLTEQKNHKLLINSFSEIIKSHSEYTLKIYGEGLLKDKLNNQIKEMNLENKVFLMGKTNNVKEEIYDAGLFVLSSDYEGMPNALIEAMSLGLPCISTDCPIGGPKELIDNYKNGILVKLNNQNEMIDAINYMLENEKKSSEMGIEANKIGNILNKNNICKKWVDYIYGLCIGDMYEK